ncbi:reverse transcriptase domain-containing protein [Tanacetum coccineum]
MDYALWAFRTTYKTPIGCTPYKLVYGKACYLPIELEHKAYWALKHANFDIKTAGDHRKVQLNELNELRDHAYENSLIYKEKTKRIHDSKIKNRVFNVGDRVLLFNSRLKIFSGKLKTRWSGPFTVTQVFPYGTIELSQNSRQNFKVNGHHLKHYFGGDIPTEDFPDCEDSRARSFTLHPQEFHILSFILGIHLNKAMMFLSSVYRSKFPSTNNQLRTSSNPITQAMVQNGQAMVQNVQGRQSQGYADNAGNNQALGARCTARKRVKDSEWFKDKILLAQAQEAGVVLDEEQQDFLAHSLEETNDSTTNAIFMANLSHVGSLSDDTVAPRYDSDTLSEVPHYDTYHDSDMLNSNIQDLGYIENIVPTNKSYDELKGNNDVISYTDYMLTIRDDPDNNVPPPVKKNDMMLSVIEK